MAFTSSLARSVMPTLIWISRFRKFKIRIESGSFLVGSGLVPDLLIRGLGLLSQVLYDGSKILLLGYVKIVHKIDHIYSDQ